MQINVVSEQVAKMKSKCVSGFVSTFQKTIRLPTVLVQFRFLYISRRILCKVFSLQFLECDDGTFGKLCSNICGHCQDGDTCDKETGACPYGCQSGYEGIYCNQSEICLFLSDVRVRQIEENLIFIPCELQRQFISQNRFIVKYKL